MGYSADDIGVLEGFESVPRRTTMYLEDVDEAGLLYCVLLVVGLAYDQHIAGRCSTISVEVAGHGTVTVEDDGPGLRAQAARTRCDLDALLTSLTSGPRRAPGQLVDGVSGLAIVNALGERLEISTVSDGICAHAVYSRGKRIQAMTSAPTQQASGTTIRFLPDAEIFRVPRVSRTALTARLDELAFLAPRLRLRWSFAADAFIAAGLAGRVATIARCAVGDVAHHRATYTAPSGPLEVEVALAWRASDADEAVVERFVNFERTQRFDFDVDRGLLEGIRRVLEPDGGRSARTALPDGLVACVAVVTRELPAVQTVLRPSLQHAREPIAEVTQAALARGAESHADAIEPLRRRAE